MYNNIGKGEWIGEDFQGTRREGSVSRFEKIKIKIHFLFFPLKTNYYYNSYYN